MFNTGDLILNQTYRIEAEAGKGGFGIVYRATHLGFNIQRAIKVLSDQRPGVNERTVAEYRERFEREADLGKMLTHPNVVKVLAFAEIEKILFLEMEFAPGGDLKRWLAGQPNLQMPIEETIRMAIDLCDGLTAIHERLGIVHRDIKPSNLLLGNDGSWKIGDLGLAQTEATRGRSLLEDIPHPGTPPYKSPEQSNPPYGYLTPASDIYALGCVMFESLTGKRYFDQRGRRVKQFRPDVPNWLEAVIADALDQNVTQRIQTAPDLRFALQNKKRITRPSLPPAPQETDVIPITLGPNFKPAKPEDFADISNPRDWAETREAFWNGDIINWLKDGISKLRTSHQIYPANVWKKILERAEAILTEAKPADPIEQSRRVIEFLKSIEGYTPPALEVDPAEIDFGEVSAGVGEKVDQSISVTNTGRGILEGVIEPAHSALGVTPADFKCAPDESAQAQVSFAPDESFIDAPTEIALRVRTNVESKDVPARFTIQPPTIQVKPTQFEFSDVEQTEPAIVTITNKGPSLLKGKVTATVPWLRLEQDSVSLRCLPGASVAIRVFIVASQVPPVGATEARALILGTNAEPRAIAAHAPLPPTLRVKPKTLDFGTLNLTDDSITPPRVTLKITNIGTGTLRGTIRAIEPGLLIAPSDAQFECRANQSFECPIALDANVPWTDKPKEFANGVMIESAGQSTQLSGRYVIAGYPPYNFAPGKQARTLKQFVELCLDNWALARNKFYAREFDEWFAKYLNRPDWVEFATMARETEKNKHAGLMEFLCELNPRAKKQIKTNAVEAAFAEAEKSVEANPDSTLVLVDWIAQQEPGRLFLGNLRSRAEKEIEKRNRLPTLFAKAKELAEQNPKQAMGLVLQIQNEDSNFPGLVKLREQIEQAIRWQEKRDRLAQKYAEAESAVHSNPQRTLELCIQIEREEPYYPGVKSLREQANANLIFIFNGITVTDVAQLVRLCEASPENAIAYLDQGEIERWLRRIGEERLADATLSAQQTGKNGPARLLAFLNATGIAHSYKGGGTEKPPIENTAKSSRSLALISDLLEHPLFELTSPWIISGVVCLPILLELWINKRDQMYIIYTILAWLVLGLWSLFDLFPIVGCISVFGTAAILIPWGFVIGAGGIGYYLDTRTPLTTSIAGLVSIAIAVGISFASERGKATGCVTLFAQVCFLVITFGFTGNIWQYILLLVMEVIIALIAGIAYAIGKEFPKVFLALILGLLGSILFLLSQFVTG